MALLAGTRLHLFFRFLLARLSDPWAHWTGRDFAGGHISSSRGPFVWLQPRLMVCAHFALAGERSPFADRLVLGGHGRVATVGSECVAARNAGDLFCVLPFVR